MTLFGALRSRTRFSQENERIHSVRYILNLASAPQSSADRSGPTDAHHRGRVLREQKLETPRWLQIAARSAAPLPRKVHRASSLLALGWSSRPYVKTCTLLFISQPLWAVLRCASVQAFPVTPGSSSTT